MINTSGNKAVTASAVPWHVALTWRVPPELLDDIVSAQYRRIYSIAPWLYFTIATMAAVGAYGSGGAFSWIYHVALPGFFITLGLYRGWTWRRRRNRILPHSQMARQIRRAGWIAAGIAVVGSAWSLDAYFATVEARRILAPVFVAFLALGAAVGISSMPRATIAVLVIALLPCAAAMIASRDIGLQSVGMSMVVLGFLMIGMVCHQFSTLVGTIGMARELRELAQTDPLTGLANRRGFHNRFTDGRPHTLLMIDLDHFKAANDRYGHEAGDAVLAEIASRLRKLCRDAVCIARLGGDEFAILLSADKAQHSKDLEHAVRAAIGLPVFYRGRHIMVGAAVGRATGVNVDALLREADTMLYREKKPKRRMARTGAA